MTTTTWTVTVPSELDEALRETLADAGMGDDALSRFVEDAVRDRIIDVATTAAHRANAHRTEAEIEAVVAEALEWARRR